MLSTDRWRKTSGEIVTRLMLIQFQPCIRGMDRYDFLSVSVIGSSVIGETKSIGELDWVGACSIACFCRVLRKGKFVIIPLSENLKRAEKLLSCNFDIFLSEKKENTSDG